MTSVDHPLAQKKEVSIEQVVEFPVILPKSGSTRKTMDRLLRPYQSRVRVAMELPSVAMIKAFVSSGMGVSLISESFATREEAAGQLKLIALADTILTRELGLVYQQDRTLPRSATAFIELASRLLLPSQS
jgi:DNA-binding transcriptional LysR family regulator